jgi:ABC-type arginine transport system permease subunit
MLLELKALVLIIVSVMLGVQEIVIIFMIFYRLRILGKTKITYLDNVLKEESQKNSEIEDG